MNARIFSCNNRISKSNKFNNGTLKPEFDNSGITLIALVITVIVIMILAAVSLNATIGDNGILAKAQTTTISTSIASLEEFLQSKYVEEYRNVTQEKGSNKTSLERMMELYPDWFYNENGKDYILKDYEYEDDDGNIQSGFLKIRLIKKNNLPDEIKSKLSIGDAYDSTGTADSDDAYNRLTDVFGVTNDLKIYYCSEGLESATGADYLLSDSYDGTKVVYNSTSALAQAIASTTGDIAIDLSLQDLRTIKSLTINSNINMSDLTALSDLPNLTKLTLSDYEGSLKGIDRAYKLSYLYIDNSDGLTNIDYTGLSKVITLSELYFYMPTNTEIEKMCTEMSNTNYNKLQTIGLYGYMDEYYINQPTWRCTKTSDIHSSLNTLSYLSNLTVTTKSNVVTLYLQNNSLTNLDGLEGFTKVSKLLLTKNYLTNIDAINSMADLNICQVNSNSLTTSCLTNFEQHSSLEYLMIQENKNIDSLESLSKTDGNPGTALKYLNAENLDNLNFDSSYWTNSTKKPIFTIETLILPSKYALQYVDVPYLRLDKSVTDSELENLKNNTYITSLNLNGCVNLTHDKIAEVIPTLINLEELNLTGTNVNNLSWMSNISDKTVLKGIVLENTVVSDISPLSNFTKLGCLAINGSSITLYYSADSNKNTIITNLINSISENIYGSWSNTCLGYGGFVPNSPYLQSQMANLINVKKWKFSNFANKTDVNVNIDLRSWTKLESFGGYCGKGTIYLPSSIKSFGKDSHATYYLDSPSNDFDITLTFSRECPVITNNTKNYTLTVSSATKSPEYYTTLFTPYLTSISITCDEDSATVDATNVNYKAATNLKKLTLKSYMINSLNFSYLPTSLTELSITKCNIKRVIKATENNISVNINVDTVDLSNNNISSVEAFEGATIKKLNLQNNSLSNYVTLNTSSGNKTVKTTEVLAEINGLEEVDLYGNSDLTDYTPLLNAGFVDDGNHNFTKNN